MENNTPDSNKNKFATAGFVLGLCSLIAWILPILGLPTTIVGIVMSVKGLKSEKRTFAIIGLVFSVILLIVTVVNMIVGAAMGVQKAMTFLN